MILPETWPNLWCQVSSDAEEPVDATDAVAGTLISNGIMYSPPVRGAMNSSLPLQLNFISSRVIVAVTPLFAAELVEKRLLDAPGT